MDEKKQRLSAIVTEITSSWKHHLYIMLNIYKNDLQALDIINGIINKFDLLEPFLKSSEPEKIDLSPLQSIEAMVKDIHEKMESSKRPWWKIFR